MIRKLYNLRCTDGHYHFSPDPKAWVGKVCMKAHDAPEPKSKKCDAEMRSGNNLNDTHRFFGAVSIAKVHPQ